MGVCSKCAGVSSLHVPLLVRTAPRIWRPLSCPLLLLAEHASPLPQAACSEQLTAFELWLEHGGPDKRPPEQLPIVLQARPGRRV